MQFEAVWQILDAGGEIVTHTPEQARFLKTQWLKRTQHSYAPSPTIKSFTELSNAWFSQIDQRPLLLAPHSVLRLWQQIIEEHNPELFEARALAKLAMRADRFLLDHQVELAKSTLIQDDVAIFLHWRTQYELRLRETGWLDDGRKVNFLVTQRPICHSHVGLWGFSDPTPQVQSLINGLKAQSIHVSHLPKVSINSHQRVCVVETEDEECQAVVSWLSEHMQTEGLIWVMDEDMANHQGLYRRLIGQHLLGTTPSADDWARAPVRFADGQPLTESLVVSDALALLSLSQEHSSVVELTRFLRSRYFRREAALQAEFNCVDRALWSLPVMEMSQHDWQRWLKTHSAGSGLAQFMSRLMELRLSFGVADASVWAQRFLSLLRQVHWPKGVTLNDTEYLAAQAFERQLERLAQSAPWLGSLNHAKALSELRLLVQEERIDTGSKYANIVLSSRFADPGLPLEGLWVAGLRAERFPRPLEPKAFIPKDLLNTLRCEGANAEQNRESAKRLREAWQSAAQDVVYSVSRSDGKSKFAAVNWLDDVRFEKYIATQANLSSLDSPLPITLNSEPAFEPLLPYSVISGGVGVIEAQAQCPFKAALDYRFNITGWEVPSYGISALVRGNWLHRALELFYSTVTSQLELRNLSVDALLAHVNQVIDDATPKELNELGVEALAAVEKEWLRKQLVKFFNNELSRTPFTVAGRERQHLANIAGYQFKMRIDRIDHVGDDHSQVILLDYKSGKAKSPHWDSLPPFPIQLPIYASFAPITDASVVGMALVFPSEKSPYKGLGEFGVKVKTSQHLSAHLNDFRTSIEAIVHDYAAGHIKAKPDKATCRHCRYGLVCRVQNISIDEDGEGGESEAPEFADSEGMA